ncbi:hypothetical protein [Janibacter sp. DB-40]|uniref:YobI family P-loop NTPase n=1 Tax=Janibacter sp. DB-40 TaxID=3028808 RepID=UPI002406C039|nr:hypothetical protein [Janibacter sp. DB-40]
MTAPGRSNPRPHAPQQVQPETASPSLLSLAPRFNLQEHGTYLRHLNEQVKEQTNRNIALTGSYGTGKSSVLQEFERTHPGETIRVGISTLGPEPNDYDLTNRLQKEVVKQLLYKVAPFRLPRSRFDRIADPNYWPIVGKSFALVSAAMVLLLTVGWLPTPVTVEAENGWIAASGWVIMLALLTTLTAWAWLAVDGREVTDVGAGGAALKLSRNTTYFDEYLDELVYFFDRTRPNYVIFEDLDRFDNVQIFEELRELNTLLNSRDQTPQHVTRFIYAIKDSLFEEIGRTRASNSDARISDGLERANRTKFFDVVIPIVPFISHMNSHRILLEELQAHRIETIEPRLLETVARHVTDMRLLRNICNEYRVFAERLQVNGDATETPTGPATAAARMHAAPGITSSKIFALVAFKNFHLKNFERISRGNSSLDSLIESRRKLIRQNVAHLEAKKREIISNRLSSERHSVAAERAAGHLTLLAESIPHDHRAPQSTISFGVNDTTYDSEALSTDDFWEALKAHPRLTVTRNSPPYGLKQLSLGEEAIKALLPGVLSVKWSEAHAREVSEQQDQIDSDLRFLRGASFEDLVQAPRFTLTTTSEEPKNFKEILEETIESSLSRDLIRHGYIDRNFTLYATQYRGHSAGVEVDRYLVHNVYTNTPDMHQQFTYPQVEALLHDAPSDFVNSHAALNVSVLEYLLDNDPAGADSVVKHIMTGCALDDPTTDASAFLSTFLNSSTAPGRLIARLAQKRWTRVFAHLAEDPSVPDDRRIPLLDTALSNAERKHTYELNKSFRDYLVGNYPQLTSLTEDRSEVATQSALAVLRRSQIVIPELHYLSGAACEAMVEAHLYQMTADNLRHALQTTGSVSIDTIIENEGLEVVDRQELEDTKLGPVLSYCIDEPDSFLDALDSDVHTPHIVERSSTLEFTLGQVSETWTSDQIDRLLQGVAPTTKLASFNLAPPSMWAGLASHHLVEVSLHNFQTYLKQKGSLDEPLADLLTGAGRLSTSADDDQETRESAAIVILQANDVLPSPSTRAELVLSLELQDPLSVDALPVEEGDLLRLLLKHQLVAESQEVFLAYRDAGWDTLNSALPAAEDVAAIASPEVLSGFVVEALDSTHIPLSTKMRILNELDAYVNDDDSDALRAVARYAVRTSTHLTAEQIVRIVTVTRDPDTTIPLLASADLDATTTMSILGKLPAPYDNFASHAQSKFEVPDDEALEIVLARLSRAHLVRSRKGKGKRHVTLPDG